MAYVICLLRVTLLPFDVLEFAINTNGRRAHPNYPAEFDIYLDTTGDGVPDFVVFNAENGGFSVTGQNVVFLGNLSHWYSNGLLLHGRGSQLRQRDH